MSIGTVHVSPATHGVTANAATMMIDATIEGIGWAGTRTGSAAIFSAGQRRRNRA